MIFLFAFKLAFYCEHCFVLIVNICSLCLHPFVYTYARLLCLLFELAEGSSPLRVIWWEKE